ncbi:MAG: TPM domain-containing protein [Acidobacteria bacterium]|nr:TPM domain-containing protein [Acidobacteriota bacterium]
MRRTAVRLRASLLRCDDLTHAYQRNMRPTNSLKIMCAASRARVFLASLLVLAAASAGALDVPYLSGRVVDEAGLLSPDAERRVVGILEGLEQQTGAQVAVLTLPSLEDEAIEDYSHRVAETWKLGRGKFDDGALLLIVRDDRLMRLEVGYGLEPVLTDALSRRILDEQLRPRFRNGDFDGGIEAAAQSIATVVSGQGDLPPPVRSRDSGRDFGGLFILFLVLSNFFFGLVRAPGKIAWVFYALLMPVAYFLPAALISSRAGVIIFGLWLVGFPILRLILPKATLGGRGGFGGWIVGGGGRHRGGWSGGGFGGGFSGGGGSFGGGGASSSW